jgi:NADPH:quinone reductase-like Zn-dependent oxidoreductase
VVGAGVDGWSVGDRVMGRGSACHAENVVVSERALIAVPARLSLVDAAAIPNVFVTAHDAIVTAARLQPGESVLVTAGSSGVGTAAIQIARYLGASKVIATTTSPKKAPALLRLGASDVVDSNGDDWSTAVRDLTGGANVVIDQVGGELARPCLAAMATSGRFVTVGRNGGSEAMIDLDRVALERLSIIGVTFRTRTPEEALACSERFVADLLAGFDDGSLLPVVDTTFALDDLPAAHEYMASDQQVGKIVIVT